MYNFTIENINSALKDKHLLTKANSEAFEDLKTAHEEIDNLKKCITPEAVAVFYHALDYIERYKEHPYSPVSLFELKNAVNEYNASLVPPTELELAREVCKLVEEYRHKNAPIIVALDKWKKSYDANNPSS